MISLALGCGAGAVGAGVVVEAATPVYAEPVYVSTPQARVSVELFHDALLPYGDWIQLRGYGHAWRPSPVVAGYDFVPYATNGQWVSTDFGWTFVSDFDWGWAPFHYGRWLYDPIQGWVWIPGSVWGPAWVDWRFGDGFVGWRPLPPPGAAVVVDRFAPAWFFVEARFFTYPHVHRFVLPREHARRVLVRSHVVENTVVYGRARWNAGPPARRVAAVARAPVPAARVTPPRPGVVAPVRVVRRGVVPVPARPVAPPVRLRRVR